jgi:hypothetical protein
VDGMALQCLLVQYLVVRNMKRYVSHIGIK